MSNGTRLFGRRTPRSPRRFLIVAYVEGDTEEQYLKHWARYLRQSVNINVGSEREAPLTMVRRAAALAKDERRLAKRGRSSVDQIWCLFDSDCHANIPEALDMARANGVYVGFSNPCLELWFLLHFQTQWAEIDRHEAQRRAYSHMGTRPKTVTLAAFDLLRSQSDDAISRATRLVGRHRTAGLPDTHNPSSGVVQLIETLRSLVGP